jgi:hypothetical protein
MLEADPGMVCAHERAVNPHATDGALPTRRRARAPNEASPAGPAPGVFRAWRTGPDPVGPPAASSPRKGG